MDFEKGSAFRGKFATNVGLISTHGPFGQNIMAAEWTYVVSYSPALIAVCIGPAKASAQNIRKTKEFGVSIAAFDQNVLSSVSGGYTGKEIDKISALKELGFKFAEGKKLNELLFVLGSALFAECKLLKEISLGDHLMFVGEVIEATAFEKEPLVYNKGKYWALSEQVQKPSDERRAQIRETVLKHEKKD